jgi:hypothetical protein
MSSRAWMTSSCTSKGRGAYPPAFASTLVHTSAIGRKE